MDHTRVDIRTSQISCGVGELSRITEDTDDVIFAVANYCNHPSRGEPCAFFLASDVTDVDTATARFMSRVVELSLGPVMISPVMFNPKTSNPIAVYTWMPDHKALKEFYLSTKIKKLESRRPKG